MHGPLVEGHGVPDLISKRQEVVVDPQPVHTSYDQLCDVAWVNTRSIPEPVRDSKITLAEDLQGPSNRGLYSAKEKTRTKAPRSGSLSPDPFRPSDRITFLQEPGNSIPPPWRCGGEVKERIWTAESPCMRPVVLGRGSNERKRKREGVSI